MTKSNANKYSEGPNSLVSRIGESYSAMRLAVGIPIAAVACSAVFGNANIQNAGAKQTSSHLIEISKKKKKKTPFRYNPSAFRYVNEKDVGEWPTTVDPEEVLLCEKLNVSYPGVNFAGDNVYYSHPYGRIESQHVSARIGGSVMNVTTRLRDVNRDVYSPFDGKSELKTDCSYLTYTTTTLQLRQKVGSGKTTEPVGDPVDVDYVEPPFLKHAKQYISKERGASLELPHPLTEKELKLGKYSISILQKSQSITQPWDLSLVKLYQDQWSTSPVISNELVDHTRTTGVLNEKRDDKGNDLYVSTENPPALQKTWRRTIKSKHSNTFNAPWDSPWTTKKKK